MRRSLRVTITKYQISYHGLEAVRALKGSAPSLGKIAQSRLKLGRNSYRLKLKSVWVQCVVIPNLRRGAVCGWYAVAVCGCMKYYMPPSTARSRSHHVWRNTNRSSVPMIMSYACRGGGRNLKSQPRCLGLRTGSTRCRIQGCAHRSMTIPEFNKTCSAKRFYIFIAVYWASSSSASFAFCPHRDHRPFLQPAAYSIRSKDHSSNFKMRGGPLYYLLQCLTLANIVLGGQFRFDISEIFVNSTLDVSEDDLLLVVVSNVETTSTNKTWSLGSVEVNSTIKWTNLTHEFETPDSQTNMSVAFGVANAPDADEQGTAGTKHLSVQ